MENTGVKFMVVYKKYADQSYVVGFANSMEDFMQRNNQRTHPYSYKEEDLKLVSLSTDVFAMATIEGPSNFVDYLR